MEKKQFDAAVGRRKDNFIRAMADVFDMMISLYGASDKDLGGMYKGMMYDFSHIASDLRVMMDKPEIFEIEPETLKTREAGE